MNFYEVKVHLLFSSLHGILWSLGTSTSLILYIIYYVRQTIHIKDDNDDYIHGHSVVLITLMVMTVNNNLTSKILFSASK